MPNSLATPNTPVTLNLFQGPSRRKRGAMRVSSQTLGLRATERFGRAEKWTPDQVRGDETGYGFA